MLTKEMRKVLGLADNEQYIVVGVTFGEMEWNQEKRATYLASSSRDLRIASHGVNEPNVSVALGKFRGQLIFSFMEETASADAFTLDAPLTLDALLASKKIDAAALSKIKAYVTAQGTSDSIKDRVNAGLLSAGKGIFDGSEWLTLTASFDAKPTRAKRK